MDHTLRILVIGAAGVILFDAIGSVASIVFTFPYPYASIGSFFIYAGVGFFIGRREPILMAFMGAALMGVVDATIGWYVSWQIGAGALPEGQLTPSVYAGTLAFVAGVAAVSGLAGAGVGKLVPRKS